MQQVEGFNHSKLCYYKKFSKIFLCIIYYYYYNLFFIKKKKRIILLNKADLATDIDKKSLKEAIDNLKLSNLHAIVETTADVLIYIIYF